MKLVGLYGIVVAGVDMGINHNKKPILELKCDFVDEKINEEFVPMTVSHSAKKFYSMDPKPGKSGKSAAQISIEQLRDTFDFKGGMNDLHDLIFKRAIAVCSDHDGKYTKIDYLNHPERGPKNQAAKLKEFSSDISDELQKIFDSIQ